MRDSMLVDLLVYLIDTPIHADCPLFSNFERISQFIAGSVQLSESVGSISGVITFGEFSEFSSRIRQVIGLTADAWMAAAVLFVCWWLSRIEVGGCLVEVDGG